MSDRKDRQEYYRQYYQNIVKERRRKEKEASQILPDLLQDLSVERIRANLLEQENENLKQSLARMAEDNKEYEEQVYKLCSIIKAQEDIIKQRDR
jgi:hypothetical protein